MAETEEERAPEPGTTYSLGAVARLTGLSPHVLRAWERRYEAVTPLRTPGGTRRYRESDVARLRLLAAATGAGHPIGDIAKLSEAELRRRTVGPEEEPRPPLRLILEAIDQLDADETERLLGVQLAALGPGGSSKPWSSPCCARWAIAGRMAGSASRVSTWRAHPSAISWGERCAGCHGRLSPRPFCSRRSRASATSSAFSPAR